jgi:hypothetical protein
MGALVPREEVAQVEQCVEEARECLATLADALQGLCAHWSYDGMAGHALPRRTERRLLMAVEVCRQQVVQLEHMALDLAVEWDRLSQWPGPHCPAIPEPDSRSQP